LGEQDPSRYRYYKCLLNEYMRWYITLRYQCSWIKLWKRNSVHFVVTISKDQFVWHCLRFLIWKTLHPMPL
jgi:hypothetical protein